MKILITGGKGMLGRDLQDELKDVAELFPVAHSDCEITEAASLQRLLAQIRPQVVINCAAYTDVDGCERSPELAMAVNAHGAGNVARAAEQVGARVYHISTDYVFDGSDRRGQENYSPGPGQKVPIEYVETDAINPLSLYGKSKLEGEKEVLTGGNRAGHLVIRTSWLYGIHRVNFIDRVMEQAQRGGPVKAVTDQISCLTWTRDLARSIARLAKQDASRKAGGILHLAGTGRSTRFENARHVLDWMKEQGKLAQPVEMVGTTWPALNLPARRPVFSAMTSARFAELGIEALPDWRASLNGYLALRSKA